MTFELQNMNPYKSSFGFGLCIVQLFGGENISGTVIVKFLCIVMQMFLRRNNKTWKTQIIFKKIIISWEINVKKIIQLHLSFILYPLLGKDYKGIFLSVSSIYEIQIIYSL